MVKPQLVRMYVFDMADVEPHRDEPVRGACDNDASAAAWDSSVQHRADRSVLTTRSPTSNSDGSSNVVRDTAG
jgi:hypothetical protein